MRNKIITILCIVLGVNAVVNIVLSAAVNLKTYWIMVAIYWFFNVILKIIDRKK